MSVIVFVLVKTLPNPNVCFPTGNPTTELSLPVVGIWGEAGLIWVQGQVQSRLRWAVSTCEPRGLRSLRWIYDYVFASSS